MLSLCPPTNVILNKKNVTKIVYFPQLSCKAMRLKRGLPRACDSCVYGYFHRVFNYLEPLPASQLFLRFLLILLLLLLLIYLFYFTAPVKNKWHYPSVDRSLQSVETTSPCIQLDIIHAPQSISCWGNCWLPRHKGSSFVSYQKPRRSKQKYLLLSSVFFFYFFLQKPLKVNDKGNLDSLWRTEKPFNAACACCFSSFCVESHIWIKGGGRFRGEGQPRETHRATRSAR